jgi:hypothetical protein
MRRRTCCARVSRVSADDSLRCGCRNRNTRCGSFLTMTELPLPPPPLPPPPLPPPPLPPSSQSPLQAPVLQEQSQPVGLLRRFGTAGLASDDPLLFQLINRGRLRAVPAVQPLPQPQSPPLSTALPNPVVGEWFGASAMPLLDTGVPNLVPLVAHTSHLQNVPPPLSARWLMCGSVCEPGFGALRGVGAGRKRRVTQDINSEETECWKAGIRNHHRSRLIYYVTPQKWAGTATCVNVCLPFCVANPNNSTAFH